MDANPELFFGLLSLTAIECVLGIDNVVFIAILAGKLPEAQQPKARRWGLILALFIRIGLLFGIAWLMKLDDPIFQVRAHPFSGKDLIMLGGGLFLIAKATHEIYDKLEVDHSEQRAAGGGSFTLVLAQILAMDVIFSLDSVITAAAMVKDVWTMITAMVLSMLVMLFAAKPISDFVNRHPSVKILALSFLILIGVMLVGDGMGQHLGKGYIYAAMAFSVFVELLNMRFRKKQKPLALHGELESAPGTKIDP